MVDESLAQVDIALGKIRSGRIVVPNREVKEPSQK